MVALVCLNVVKQKPHSQKPLCKDPGVESPANLQAQLLKVLKELGFELAADGVFMDDMFTAVFLLLRSWPFMVLITRTRARRQLDHHHPTGVDFCLESLLVGTELLVGKKIAGGGVLAPDPHLRVGQEEHASRREAQLDGHLLLSFLPHFSSFSLSDWLMRRGK